MPTITTTTLPSWREWMRAKAGNDNQKTIAEKTDLDKGGISRWLSDTEARPSAPSALKFARAYGANPVEALVVAGYLTGDEANLDTAIWSDPALIPTDVLLAEVARRAQGHAA